MMKKCLLNLTVAALIFATSCKEKYGKMNLLKSTDTFALSNKEKLSIVTNDAGDSLTMIFDTTRENAKVIWKQDTIHLQTQRAASGFWYKNHQFELRGKGEKVNFSKGGNSVFSN